MSTLFSLPLGYLSVAFGWGPSIDDKLKGLMLNAEGETKQLMRDATNQLQSSRSRSPRVFQEVQENVRKKLKALVDKWVDVDLPNVTKPYIAFKKKWAEVETFVRQLHSLFESLLTKLCSFLKVIWNAIQETALHIWDLLVECYTVISREFRSIM